MTDLIKVIAPKSPTVKYTVPDGAVVVDKGMKILVDGSEVASKSESLDFEHGLTAEIGSNGDVKVELKGQSPVPEGKHFAGIYKTVTDLQDAIPNPTGDLQAIVLNPSEYYYEVQTSNWVVLSPVGSVYSGYVGLYDSLADLNTANPTPVRGSLAIVGTDQFSIYTYTTKWNLVNHYTPAASDAKLDALTKKVSANTSGQVALKNRMNVAEGHLQTLQQQDIAMADDITQLQSEVFTGIHIEDDDGNSFDDITGLAFDGATVQDDQGTGLASVIVKPKITVANGQELGSSSAMGNALIFEGATVEADKDDANVIKVTIPSGSSKGISLGDGVNASRDVTTVILRGHEAYGSGNTAEIHLEFAHFKTIAERDDWSTKFGLGMNFDTVAVVDSDENGFVQWYKFNAATKKWVDYYAQGVVMSDSNGAIPKNIKTIVFGSGFAIQQAGDQEDAALVTYTESGAGGIDGITVAGQKVTEFDLGPNLQLDNSQSSPRLLINPRAFEEQHAASCLLQLDSDVTLEGDHATKLYTSHEIIPTGEYYSLNQSAGGVNVQDNTGGDTAITGGELTRILASVAFYGKATSDSNIKAWVWYKDPASPLAGGVMNDVNGNPMIVTRHVNSGDDLSQFPLIIGGAMMATGNAPIVLYVEVDGGSYIVDPDKTLMCIEQFSDGFETSLASIEFQRRAGIEIHAEIKNFTDKMLSLKDELVGKNLPEVNVAVSQGYDFINEFGVQNLTAMKASISNDAMHLKDSGGISDFYLDTYIDNIKTTMLRGKTIDYDVTVSSTQDAWRLEAYKWTGDADRAGKIYSARSNGALILNDGFTLVKSKFISEQSDGQYRGYTDSIVVPDDAINLFIIIRPINAQMPLNLSIKDFTWGVSKDFRGYREVSRVNLHEEHLRFSDKWAEFALTSADGGFASLRYTINNTPSAGNPMPLGKLLKGRADVSIDNTVNQVGGSADPQFDGAIKFNKDGEASISKSYNLWNEQGTDNTVTFWDVLIDVDGNETKIIDSERTFTVPKNTGAPGIVYSIPAYAIDVETGQRVGGRATSNKADGAYVQSQNVSEYLVQTIVELKELVATADDTDLISAPLQKSLVVDRRYHEFAGNTGQNITISDFAIPSDVVLASVTADRITATGYSSIDEIQHSYNSDTKVMTVHVGGVDTGVVFFEFWSK